MATKQKINKSLLDENKALKEKIGRFETESKNFDLLLKMKKEEHDKVIKDLRAHIGMLFEIICDNHRVTITLAGGK